MNADIDRLRAEYAQRRNRAERTLYSTLNLGHLCGFQQRQRETVKLLRAQGITSLVGKRILELGCGNGGVLLEYLGFGALVKSVYGVDLLPDQLMNAHASLPGLNLVCADGQRLPFGSSQFDLVLQYTAFSSILDEGIRRTMASEMMRVLRRPDGRVIWYDFWLNPKNPQTRGIHLAEIRQLFPGWTLSSRRITLAPPISRRVAPISWRLCTFLQSILLLNTHYLVLIRPE